MFLGSVESTLALSSIALMIVGERRKSVVIAFSSSAGIRGMCSTCLTGSVEACARCLMARSFCLTSGTEVLTSSRMMSWKERTVFLSSFFSIFSCFRLMAAAVGMTEGCFRQSSGRCPASRWYQDFLSLLDQLCHSLGGVIFSTPSSDGFTSGCSIAGSAGVSAGAGTSTL